MTDKIAFQIYLKSFLVLIFISMLLACQPKGKHHLDPKVLSSLGSSVREGFEGMADDYLQQLKENPNDLQANLGYAESKILLYIFGYSSREENIPAANQALGKALKLDSLHTESLKVKGILHFLDWNWAETELAFQRSIMADSSNMSARHWYSLYHAAMGNTQAAMLQHDTIMKYDQNEDYLVGRGSIYYFLEDYATLKKLMKVAVAKDTLVPWPHDWLGMAYNGLKEHDQSLTTYFRAFELSDGTVEIGAGLGHALGDAGEKALAKEMADYYSLRSVDDYLPYCQRSFIHISIGEHEKALDLLEQAFQEKSWFLIFMKIEPWYNPVRKDNRFLSIMKKMKYPA